MHVQCTWQHGKGNMSVIVKVWHRFILHIYQHPGSLFGFHWRHSDLVLNNRTITEVNELWIDKWSIYRKLSILIVSLNMYFEGDVIFSHFNLHFWIIFQYDPPPPPIAYKNSLFKINRLFSINSQIFGLKHAVYMSIKEFLSKKRQLPLGSKSEGKGGGGCPQAPVFLG